MSYPKVTLKADFENGEGDIGNLDKWRNHDWLVRADILKDWVYLLEQEYNNTLRGFDKTID